jgi:hypothetical protein
MLLALVERNCSADWLMGLMPQVLIRGKMV